MSAVSKCTFGFFLALLLFFPSISTRAVSQPAGIQAFDLGTLGGYTGNAEPAALNDSGQAVGTSDIASLGRRAFIWASSTGIKNLGTLGGNYSFAASISSKGEVVGSSSLPGDAVQHAFYWRSGAGMIELPTLGDGTHNARKINGKGAVVGVVYPPDGTERSFFWTSAGGIRELAGLGGSYTDVVDLNDNGQAVGSSQTASGSYHAVLWDATGAVTDLGHLGGDASNAVAINGSGQIVGSSNDPYGNSHAFLFEKGVMKDLGTLNNTSYSVGTAINNFGQIVGYGSADENGTTHAFLWTKDKGMRDLGSLEAGGWSEARGINDQGKVIGRALFSNSARGFAWTPGQGMQDIGTLNAWTEAVAVNGSGQILAWSTNPRVFTRTVIVDRLGSPQDLGTLAGGESKAIAVNDNGRVAGESLTVSGFTHAFFWKEGRMEDLGSIGETHSQAVGMNSKDEVVARTGQYLGDALQPFFWSKRTGKIEIPGLGGFRWDAAAINNNSQVAGWSFMADGHVHAFLWSPSGGTIDLAPGSTFDSFATAINDDGVVVGYRFSDDYERSFAWCWKPGTGMVDLPDLGGQFTFAWAVNKFGWVAGESDNPATYRRSGVIWKNGQLIDLGTLGGGSARPRAINASGVAVGVSDLTEWPPSHAFSGASAPLRDLGVVIESHQFSDARSINDVGEIVGISSDTDSRPFSWRAFLVRGLGPMIDLGTLGGDNGEATSINAQGQVSGRAQLPNGEVHAVLWNTR